MDALIVPSGKLEIYENKSSRLEFAVSSKNRGKSYDLTYFFDDFVLTST